MKIRILPLLFLFIAILFSCKKDNVKKDDPKDIDDPKDGIELSFVIDNSQLLEFEPGSTLKVDFVGTGINEVSVGNPKGWSSLIEVASSKEKGELSITAPSIDDQDYAEEGEFTISVFGDDDQKIERKISVKVIVDEYTKIKFVDVSGGAIVTGAKLLFHDGETYEEVELKENDGLFVYDYEAEEHDALVSGVFQTDKGEIVYYFPPKFTIEQEDDKEYVEISLKAPELFTYWQGGILISIDDQKTGIEAYNIKGLAIALEETKLPWHHIAEENIPGTKNDNDGAGNTQAIIAHQHPANPSGGRAVNTAARWVEYTKWGGHEDWFLPSVNELVSVIQLYIDNKSDIDAAVNKYGGTLFKEQDSYWSSSENSAKHAKFVYKSNASIDLYGPKPTAAGVLAVRKF